MKSMNPIKSIRLIASPTKRLEETDEKGVVTSVHGIIDTQFSNFTEFYNAVEGKKKSLLQANYRNKNLQVVAREIKTIKLEMPVLGLEQAVVYPKNKPSKLPLKKRILKKIIHSEPELTATEDNEEIIEAVLTSSQDIKCEKKDTKSVTFLNLGNPTETTKDVQRSVDDQQIAPISQEDVMRTKCTIKIQQKVASDTIIQQKHNAKELPKEGNLNDKVISNEMIFKTEGDMPKQLFSPKKEKPVVPPLNENVLNDKLIAQCIINKSLSIIDQTTPPLSICQFQKDISQGIKKKPSFGSKIPKPTKFFKYTQKVKHGDGQKLKEIQTVSKARESKTSIISNNELKRVGTNTKLTSKSHDSQTFTTEEVTSQVSQTVAKVASTSKTNQSIGSTSKTNQSIGSTSKTNQSIGSTSKTNQSIGSTSKMNQSRRSTSKTNHSNTSTSKTNQNVTRSSSPKARPTKVKIETAHEHLAAVKKLGEKARFFNKNNKKKPSVAAVKSKVASKPIKEIKNTLQDIPINKKARTTSSRNLKRK